jgi:CHAT domain-containing protein
LPPEPTEHWPPSRAKIWRNWTGAHSADRQHICPLEKTMPHRTSRILLLGLALALAAAPPSPVRAQAPTTEEMEERVDDLNGQALTAFQNGNRAEARRLARQAMDLAAKHLSKSSEIYQDAVRALAVVTDGIAAYTNGAVANPEPPPPKDQILSDASVAMDAGQLAKVEALLRPLLASSPDDSVRYMLGDALLDQGRAAEALAIYPPVADQSDGRAAGPDLLLRHALANYGAGRAAEGDRLFAQTMALNQRVDPKIAAIYAAMGEPVPAALSYGYFTNVSDILDRFERSGRAAQVEPLRARERDAFSRVPMDSLAQSYFQAYLTRNLLLQPGKWPAALADARTVAAATRRALSATEAQWSAAEASMNRMTAAEVFVTLADAHWNAVQHDKARQAAYQGEAFLALQEASSSAAARALAAAAQERAAPAEVAQRRRLQAEWQALDSGIVAAYSRGDSAGARALISQQAALDTRIAALNGKIAALPRTATVLGVAPLDLAAARALLRSDEALLVLQPGSRATHALLVTDRGETWHRAPMSYAVLAADIATLRNSLDPLKRPPSAAAWAYDRATAHRLYKTLLAPLEPALAGRRHLLVVTGGLLAAVPLAALVTALPSGRDDDPGALRATAWLADRHAISQLPSVAALALLRQSGRALAPTGFLGMGNPLLSKAGAARVGTASAVRGLALGSQHPPITRNGRLLANPAALRTLPQLPGTVAELDSLRTSLAAPVSSVQLGAAATERAAKSLIGRQRGVLAFATHAMPGGAIGLPEPGLVFTPPAAPDAVDDGLLTLSEIAALSTQAQWAVLSACDTAAGGPGGELLSGLARAFLQAGVKNLLVSHWPVMDAVAPRLTGDLFAGTNQPMTAEPALKLQAAMRAVRNSPDHPAYAHPAVWAPFVLVGDGRQG